jgi:hypothetical protein
MKRFIYMLVIIPTICFSQSEGVSEAEKPIGQFYDEINKATFSLTKNEENYNLCFFNEIADSKQMKCLTFNEPESSMLSFFAFGSKILESSEMLLDKDWETPQYRIIVSKNGNFIILKIWDNYSKSLAVTPLISKVNWKALFGKS